MSNFFKNLIKLYRIFLSPILGGQCRFTPTCSAYALEALNDLPLPLALKKILKRVLSCHPFHAGGFDPVVKEFS